MLLSAILNITITVLSLIALGFAVYFVKKQEDAPKGFTHMFIAIVFDVIANFIGIFESSSLMSNMNASIEYVVFLELIFLFLAFVYLLISALKFRSIASIGIFSILPLLIIGIALNWYVIFILSDGDTVALLRLIYPCLGYLTLAIAFFAKKGIHRPTGFIFSGFILAALALSYLLKIFPIGYGLYEIWYLNSICYIVLTFALILVSNNILSHRIGVLENKAANSQEKLQKIVEASPFPIVLSRLSDDQIILVNRYASKVLGLNYDRPFIHKTADFFADEENRLELVNKLKQNPFIDDFEVLVKSGTNDPFWMLSSSRIIDFDYDLVVYSAFHDIDARKHKEKDLLNKATTDPLTRLYNRRYLLEIAEQELQKSQESGEPFSILMLDADHFKDINDTYGHEIGDRVLVELSRSCEKALRDTDIIARYGGEEFVLLLANTHIRAAGKVAERLRETISNLEVIGKTEEDKIQFTVSIGVSESTSGDNVEEIINHADIALYKAKQNGRNRVEISQAPPLEEAKEEKIEKIEIKEAILIEDEIDDISTPYKNKTADLTEEVSVLPIDEEIIEDPFTIKDEEVAEDVQKN